MLMLSVITSILDKYVGEINRDFFNLQVEFIFGMSNELKKKCSTYKIGVL